MQKKTAEQFKQEVYEIFGNEYSLLEEYQGQGVKGHRNKILVRHNLCGKEYHVYPDSLLQKHGCLDCYKREKQNRDKRVTTENILEHIKSEKNNNFELLEHYYKNGAAQIKVKHLACGNILDIDYQHFKTQIGCNICAEKQRRKSHTKTDEQFKKEIYEIHGNEIDVLNSYKGVLDLVTVKHNICGTTYLIRAHDLLKGNSSRCPKCAHDSRAEKKSMTTEEFIIKMQEKWGNEFEVLGEYKRSQIKIKVRHQCGHEYKVVPASLLMGFGCPRCCHNNSKGCRKIEDFLQDNNFDYITEFKIKECKHKLPLPFDFAILEKDKIKLLIEYDGQQHFEPIDFFGGEKAYLLTKQRDNIKNRYCNNNNIKLLRISYDNYDKINEMLIHTLAS